MEGSASIERDEPRPILDADEVGRKRRACPPYERDGLKYAQAVISQTPEGDWKISLQSDKQVETQLTGSLESVIKELRRAATREWHKRSRY